MGASLLKKMIRTLGNDVVKYENSEKERTGEESGKFLRNLIWKCFLLLVKRERDYLLSDQRFLFLLPCNLVYKYNFAYPSFLKIFHLFSIIC